MNSIYANSLGIFILTISANFTGDLFGCGYKKTLENPIVKHIVAFLLLIFFIVLTSKDQFINPDNKDKLITIQLLKSALLIYSSFLVISKTDFGISIAILCILASIMLMNIEKENKSENTKKNIEKYIDVSTYIAILLGIFGFIKYYQRQKLEHADDFTMYKFLLGTTKCA